MTGSVGSFTLSNGNKIPAVGFGTGIAKGLTGNPFKIGKLFIKETVKKIVIPGFRENNRYPLKKDLQKDASLRTVVQTAVDTGCRLFDTARAYEYSERYLGEVLKNEWEGIKSGKREDYFIITKATNHAQRHKMVEECFEESLQNLGIDYVDLYLLHWPQTGTWLEAWNVLEELYESGRARAIGVCNCHVHHLQELKKAARIQPMANELECHPLLSQQKVREYCRENKIQLIAHTPTGKMDSRITDSDIVRTLCQKYGVSASRIILRWHYQLGDVSIPNTTNPEHVQSNLAIWDFSLTQEEMKELSLLDCGYRIWPDPDCCDFTKL